MDDVIDTVWVAHSNAAQVATELIEEGESVDSALLRVDQMIHTQLRSVFGSEYSTFRINDFMQRIREPEYCRRHAA
jgi:hypothetical protein